MRVLLYLYCSTVSEYWTLIPSWPCSACIAIQCVNIEHSLQIDLVLPILLYSVWILNTYSKLTSSELLPQNNFVPLYFPFICKCPKTSVCLWKTISTGNVNYYTERRRWRTIAWPRSTWHHLNWTNYFTKALLAREHVTTEQCPSGTPCKET